MEIFGTLNPQGDFNTEKKVYKSSKAQRAANRRYREKVKDTEEYKQKNIAWAQNYALNNKEKFDNYQREYKRNAYQKKKLQQLEKLQKIETEILLPIMI